MTKARRMTREEYQRDYGTTGYRHPGGPVVVPDDIERVSEHTPCFWCGQARGCEHRRRAA
jgi:DNA polymerase III alpha subunit (gram-positive type)